MVHKHEQCRHARSIHVCCMSRCKKLVQKQAFGIYWIHLCVQHLYVTCGVDCVSLSTVLIVSFRAMDISIHRKIVANDNRRVPSYFHHSLIHSLRFCSKNKCNHDTTRNARGTLQYIVVRQTGHHVQQRMRITNSCDMQLVTKYRRLSLKID
jgi:hypothetical protein